MMLVLVQVLRVDVCIDWFLSDDVGIGGVSEWLCWH